MTVSLEAGRRAAGILLHPTSLPGPGIGDLGGAAFAFVDWLAAAEQTYWQILPLVPVDAGGSPYNGLSAMAGNTLLISPEVLERAGWIERQPVPESVHPGRGVIDYPAVARWKDRIIREAVRNLVARGLGPLKAEFETFRHENRGWLPDYALFRALREHYRQICWVEWPAEIRERDQLALGRWRARLEREVETFVFGEFIFEREWHKIRRYANERGIRIIGDIPIFVAYDSADVWANQEIFELDADGHPTVVAGVPPDYFSPTGQRWGNPLYRWDVLRARGFDWWIERFRRTLNLVDVARIDHFRGFESYWEIPAEEVTAIRGRWVPGPGLEFFRAIERALGPLPLLAEDLGIITPEVERLRAELGYPGMRVLQFAFDGNPQNPHLPENYPARSVAYTGTHDNTTIVAWWQEMGREERVRVRDWLRERDPNHWRFIEAVLDSRADLAIVPVQDVLGLGAEGRMNTPGQTGMNWAWRMDHLPGIELAEKLAHRTRRAGRARSLYDQTIAAGRQQGKSR